MDSEPMDVDGGNNSGTDGAGSVDNDDKQEAAKRLFHENFEKFRAEGDSRNVAAAKALRSLKNLQMNNNNNRLNNESCGEGETKTQELSQGDFNKNQIAGNKDVNKTENDNEHCMEGNHDDMEASMKISEENVNGSVEEIMSADTGVNADEKEQEPRSEDGAEKDKDQINRNTSVNMNTATKRSDALKGLNSNKRVKNENSAESLEDNTKLVSSNARTGAQETKMEVQSEPDLNLLTSERIKQEIELAKASGSFGKIKALIWKGFSDPDSVKKSFTRKCTCTHNFGSNEESNDISLDVCVDLDEIGLVYSYICAETELVNTLSTALGLLSAEFMPKCSHMKDVVHVIVGLYMPPFYAEETGIYERDFNLFTKKLIDQTDEDGKRELLHFFKYHVNEEHFRFLFTSLFMYITVRMADIGNEFRMADFKNFRHMIEAIDILHTANEKLNYIQWDEFYQDGLNQVLAEHDRLLIDDHRTWFLNRMAKGELEGAPPINMDPLPYRVSYCEFPYLLNPGSKARLLELEVREMQAYNRAINRSPIIIIRVRREHIVEDALNEVRSIPKAELTNALRVQFIGEEGVDEGGVRKEFFLLLTRQLLDPGYGMFVEDPDTHNLFFNPDSYDLPIQCAFVGILLALAIYNSVILDVHFPKVLYLMLLGHRPTLEDLKEANPALGNGLEKMLKFDGDVENTFCRNFDITYEVFGEKKTVELKENGSNIPVTNENRQEYVDLYVDYHLVKSVKQQYDAFSKGFHDVCHGEPLRLFRAEELELIICGSPTLDFAELEASTRYDDGYTESSSVMRWFWEIVHEMSLEEKKKLLMFATGTDRVPVRGLGHLRLTISKHGGDSDRLPSAHTCFNHLLIPEYSSKQKLAEKLQIAIKHSQGFGTL